MANKVQIITDDDAEFICSECESELEKVVEKAAGGDDEELRKKRQKRLISIGVISIILLAIIGGIIAMSGSGEETPKQEPVTVVPVDSDSIKAAQMAAENQRLKDSLAAVEAANAKKQEQPTETRISQHISNASETSAKKTFILSAIISCLYLTGQEQALIMSTRMAQHHLYIIRRRLIRLTRLSRTPT
jgi:hypothetical protein